MLVAALLLLAGERAALGVWDRWAALRAGDPPRCYAIAQPVLRDGTTDRGGAFASVAAEPARGAGRRATVYLRLSQPRAPGAPATLAIGERRFALVGDARSVRAPDAATARAITAAMRGARGMTLSTITAGGAAFTDAYTLPGAATAIDAALLGCRARRG